MKKLFILGSFLTILLFLLGCQSESPISPIDHDITILEKGRIKMTANLTPDADLIRAGFVKISLGWNAIPGATSYLISYYDLQYGIPNEVEVGPEVTSLDIYGAMLQVSGYPCDITIQAGKLRKGQEVPGAKGSQTFTWTGTSLVEITNITGSISQSSNVGGYVELNADWDDVTNAGYYRLAVNESWDGLRNLSSVFSSYLGAFDPHILSNGDYVSVIFRAFNSTDDLIGIGTAKFTYTE